ncbi:MAG: VWA domain-containing protein [Deltaproteobacteria bacterium]|nr:VWA domain-containing protein [Deltaproteobacteria bacterium]
MSLGFLHPLLLWGLAAAALPLLVHLFFRRRPRPTPFPALDFLFQARRENQRRLRLRKLLLFLARTFLLAAVALAIARPELLRPQEAAAAARGPAATAIVLDASASMTYRLGGRSLFERARQDALQALASLGNDEPATALVCGGGEAPRAEPAGFDKAAVRRVLEEAEPTALHADMSGCAAAAARALSESASASMLSQRLVLATDLTASAWRLDAAAPLVQTPRGAVRPEVTLLDAARGEPLPDLGVADLSVEPDPAAGPRGFRVTVAVANRGRAAAEDVPLQLRTGLAPAGPVALRAFVTVPPGGVVKKQLSLTLPAGGTTGLTVSLPGDALEYDDARALVVDVPREVRALLVDGAASPVKHRDAAFFAEAALASPASPVRPTVVDGESLSRTRFADHDVVLLLNVRSLGPKAEELRTFVEKGGGLFVAMGDQVDPDTYAEQLGGLLPRPLHVVKTAAEKGQPGAAERAARFATLDQAHPALSLFAGAAAEGITGARTYRYMLLRPARKGEGDQVLMAFDDGSPALVAARRGAGRVLLYTSTADREWSDWPIRTSFLPALQRFVSWLAGSLEERRTTSVPVGVPRALGAPEGKKVVAVVGPDGKERRPGSLAGAGPGGAAEVTPDRPGLWQVKVAEGGQERLDPSLAFAAVPDAREADTSRLEPSELTAWFGGQGHAHVAADAAPRSERPTPLWSLLLLAAVVLFLAEGLLLA